MHRATSCCCWRHPISPGLHTLQFVPRSRVLPSQAPTPHGQRASISLGSRLLQRSSRLSPGCLQFVSPKVCHWEPTLQTPPWQEFPSGAMVNNKPAARTRASCLCLAPYCHFHINRLPPRQGRVYYSETNKDGSMGLCFWRHTKPFSSYSPQSLPSKAFVVTSSCHPAQPGGFSQLFPSSAPFLLHPVHRLVPFSRNIPGTSMHLSLFSFCVISPSSLQFLVAI